MQLQLWPLNDLVRAQNDTYACWWHFGIRTEVACSSAWLLYLPALAAAWSCALLLFTTYQQHIRPHAASTRAQTRGEPAATRILAFTRALSCVGLLALGAYAVAADDDGQSGAESTMLAFYVRVHVLPPCSSAEYAPRLVFCCDPRGGVVFRANGTRTHAATPPDRLTPRPVRGVRVSRPVAARDLHPRPVG